MSVERSKLTRTIQLLRRLPIFYRILIGNSIIILAGAIGGTLITLKFSDSDYDLWLILLFSIIGLVVSAVFNSFIIRASLSPLYQLRTVMAKIDQEQSETLVKILSDTDPDIYQLATIIDRILVKLANRTEQLSALSGRLIHLQEDEHVKIARELHDETGQALTMMIIHLERLKSQVPQNERMDTEINRLQDLAAGTLKDLKNIIYGLRPMMLDDLGLVPAIRWYARTSLEKNRVQVEVIEGSDLEQIPSDENTAMYRIAQEVINNINRHAEAKTVKIKVYRESASIIMEFRDDGKGFDPKEANSQALAEKKLGLLGIKERAELVGGTVVIESKIGSGTRVKVSIPYLSGN